MQTKLPLITHEECTALSAAPLGANRICTFDRRHKRTACMGDEGGPLVYNDRLLGIFLSGGWPAWVQPDIFFNFNNINIHHMVNLQMNALRVNQ